MCAPPSPAAFFYFLLNDAEDGIQVEAMGPFSASLPPSSNSPRGRAVDPLNLGAWDEGAVIGTASQNKTNQEQLFGTYRSGLSSPVGTVRDRAT